MQRDGLGPSRVHLKRCGRGIDHPASLGHPTMQVKVQTVPGFAKGMLDGFPKFIAENGVGG